MSIEPDTKDWTWVVERPCPDCGYDAADVATDQLVGLLHDNTRGWYDVLADADFAVRPAPQVWSRLEYACHVRDVHELFARRVRLILEQDDPVFDDWDQDATAVEQRYDQQDPVEVGIALVERAAECAATYADVVGGQWERPGRRSNGSRFTVASLGRYHLHDVTHHLWDVGLLPSAAEPLPGS